MTTCLIQRLVSLNTQLTYCAEWVTEQGQDWSKAEEITYMELFMVFNNNVSQSNRYVPQSDNKCVGEEKKNTSQC